MPISNRKDGVYSRIRSLAAIKAINSVISSGFGVAILAILTVLSFIYSCELYFYTFVIAYALYVCAFADDLLPLMPLFLLCYVSPSSANNPGNHDTSIFYGETGRYLIALVSLVVVALLLRIGLDKNIGYKKFFTMKRSLLIGMLLLGAAYMLSGVGSAGYAAVYRQNLLFAAIQFASIFLLYFIFSATVDWKKAKPQYMAWIGLIVSLVVVVELIYCYRTQGFGANGAINRTLYTGWGISNNMGCMIMLGIPFCFYLSTRYRFASPFVVTALVLLAGVIFTGSRASSLMAIAIFPICYIYAFVKCRSKIEYGITSLLLVILAFFAVRAYQEQILDVLRSIPRIFTMTEEGIIQWEHNGRFSIYRDGIRAFQNAPIFGQTFYPLEYTIYDFATVKEFSSFFPPRWHNTIIQILASCGAVGIVSYLVHRAQTVWLFVRRRNAFKNFVAIVVLALLVNSFLDCHFFNVGPVFLYSMVLAFAEFALPVDESPVKKEGKESNE